MTDVLEQDDFRPAAGHVTWVLLWSVGLLLVFAPLATRIFSSER